VRVSEMGDRMKTKATYSFAEFIRPDCFWPHPYTLEQAFGVLKWMIDSGQGYFDATRWGTQTIEGLLSKKPTCTGFREIEPVISIDDLRERFHYALLSRNVGPNLARWRREQGIEVGGKRTMVFPHGFIGSNHDFKVGLSALMATSGRLKVQLNECHSRATEVYGVALHTNASAPGWRFVLRYGFDGSMWYHVLSRQTKKETFGTAFKRAKTAICDLMIGGAA
jgi:hypothetical protein